jgi:hypothetical protein
MSSPNREPLSGTIRQDKKVVGAICLPEADVQDFINQFNRCYGPMGLHIDMPSHLPVKPVVVVPIGATQGAATVAATSTRAASMTMTATSVWQQEALKLDAEPNL